MWGTHFKEILRLFTYLLWSLFLLEILFEERLWFLFLDFRECLFDFLDFLCLDIIFFASSFTTGLIACSFITVSSFAAGLTTCSLATGLTTCCFAAGLTTCSLATSFAVGLDTCFYNSFFLLTLITRISERFDDFLLFFGVSPFKNNS